MMTLRCPTCGFINQMVDAETAFCPNCGNPYQPDTTGNNLTVPATPSFVPDAAYVPYSSRSPYPTQAPTGYGTGFNPPPPAVTPPRRRTRVGSFMSGMFVALGIVVLAICSLAALAAAKKNGSTSTAQNTTPTLTVSAMPITHTPIPTLPYIDPAGYFRITYPANWQESTAPATGLQGQGTSFASTEGAVKFVEVLVTPTVLTTATLPLFITSTSGTGYVETRAPVTITIANIHWRKVEGNYNDARGQPYHAAEFVTRHNLRTFVIVLVSPQAEYDEAYRGFFQPMLASIIFMK